jgi:hypothetical protein
MEFYTLWYKEVTEYFNDGASEEGAMEEENKVKCLKLQLSGNYIKQEE